MTTKTLLTGNAAAAWEARLADVDYIPAFPITLQTEIIELMAQWTNDQWYPNREGCQHLYGEGIDMV